MGLVVTAAHVIIESGLDKEGSSAIAIQVPGRSNLEMVPVKEWVLDCAHDLAVGLFETELELTGFEIYSKTVWEFNVDVGSIEHSGSIKPHPTQDGVSTISPLFRKGYVVQLAPGLHPNFTDSRMLEVSFPALKGASGSPVFQISDLKVVGLTSGNLERQIMPAQILSAYDEDGSKLEEIRYFLPNGLAIGYVHINELVERVLKSHSLVIETSKDT